MTMIKQLATAALMTGALAISADVMAGDAAAGKAKAAVCGACHGANGMAAADMYPNLAGQNKTYLIAAMKAYKNKQRQGGMSAVMQGQAVTLSDADIENLAEYYSAMK